MNVKTCGSIRVSFLCIQVHNTSIGIMHQIKPSSSSPWYSLRPCLAGLWLRFRGSSSGGATPNALPGGAVSACLPEEPKPFCTYGGGARICGFAALAPAPAPPPATEHCGRSPAKHDLI